MKPILVVSVDTEEEFDWTGPFSSENRSVRHIADLPRLQEVFDDCGVRPSYLVDHPIAVSDESVRLLDGWQRRGACEIGAHLHPWVNPPVRELVGRHTSYLCNLPLDLQREKLATLTEEIKKSFGVAPLSFKAGRYGLDFALSSALREQGYQVDASVRALEDCQTDGGPDFAHLGPEPFWIGSTTPQAAEERKLLEVPCSVGFNRRPVQGWARLHRRLARLRWGPIRPVGLLWHLHIMRRIALAPEEHGLADLVRLARTLAGGPLPVLHLTLHSPSVGVGHTPYVRTLEERQQFLATLRGALRFITRELGAKSLPLRECPAELRSAPLPVRAVDPSPVENLQGLPTEWASA